MAAISAVIVPAKVLKGGKHKIRISVSHNGETRYILTDITVNSEKEFRNGAIVRRPDAAFLNTKLRGILQKHQETLAEIDYTDGLKCAELVELLKQTKSAKNCSLAYIYNEYIESSTSQPSSLAYYGTAWRTITKNVNPNLPAAHVTYGTIIGLEKFLRNRKLSISTISNYMRIFSSVINYGKKCGYVAYKLDPFASYKAPQPEVRDSWLTTEQVRRIRDLRLEKKNLVFCRDMFMLSYYLGGINMADLIDMDFDRHPTTVEYVRRKTRMRSKSNKTVQFAIPEEARTIIERYKGADGRIRFTDGQRKDRMNRCLRHNLRVIADKTGIDNLVYYSARKSFGQHAYELGIKTYVIDYILGHSLGKQGKSLYHYVYVSPEMATEAIRKVLDNLK